MVFVILNIICSKGNFKKSLNIFKKVYLSEEKIVIWFNCKFIWVLKYSGGKMFSLRRII